MQAVLCVILIHVHPLLVQAVQRTPTSQWVDVERWAVLADDAAAELCKGDDKACTWRVRVRATAVELHTLWVQRIEVSQCPMRVIVSINLLARVVCPLTRMRKQEKKRKKTF